jgi:hypothetical protein
VTSDLERLCASKRVGISAVYGGVEIPDGWTPGTHPYKVTLRYQGRRLTVPFFVGPAHEKEPTAADVLSCLCSDVRSADQSFEEWARDFGYDVDSRKAERTYQACVKLAPKVQRLLGEDFDEFANAEH